MKIHDPPGKRATTACRLITHGLCFNLERGLLFFKNILWIVKKIT
jgi:hypothetical protein